MATEECSNKNVSRDERMEIYNQAGNLGADETLRALTFAIADYLELFVAKDIVDQAMAKLLEPLQDIAGHSMAYPSEWRDVADLTVMAGFTEWPIGDLLYSMRLYAEYGVVYPVPTDAEEGHERLTQQIEQLKRFYERSPLALWNIPQDNDLMRCVTLATNRWALDNGDPIDPAALAMFGGVSEGRIRNMLTGQSRTFNPVGGKVPAQEALAWLSTREDYWNSIWRTAEQPNYAVKREAPVENAVFLPVARDGSVFHPGEARNSRYTIGQKGSEEQIEDFERALETLHRMPTPHWRRPNEKGNWGIVAGARWVRFDRAELEAISNTPGYRIPSEAHG